MRAIFTDGWNSIWHFIFGIIGYKIQIIVPVFLIYQYILKYDHNSGIDTQEFDIGFMLYKTLSYPSTIL
jgi:hypothetical protein